MLTQSKQAPYLICHAPGKTILARWQEDQTAIRTILAGLAMDGVGGISLSPWFNHPDPDLGIATSFDFAPILKAIKGYGIPWVQVAPQFYTSTGASDARVNGMGVLDVHWNTIYYKLYQPLLASGLGFLIDACTEFNDEYTTNASFAGYVEAMWDNVTLTSAPGGVPCWAYTMSFNTSDPNKLTPALKAFQGNRPAITALHPYSNENGGIYATLQLCRQAVGGGLWALTETDTLLPGQEATAQQLNQFVMDTHQLIQVVCPWPWMAGTGGQLSPVPQVVSRPWTGVGA